MVGGTTPLMAAVQGEHMHCAAVLLDHGATSSTEVPPAAVATGKDPATSLLVAAAGVLELLSNEHAVKDPGLLLSVGEAVRHLALQAQDAVEEASTGSPPAVQAEQCQQILTLLEAADAVPGARPIIDHLERSGSAAWREKRVPVDALGPALSEMIQIVRDTDQDCSKELRAALRCFTGAEGGVPPETIDARLVEEMLNVVEFEYNEVPLRATHTCPGWIHRVPPSH